MVFSWRERLRRTKARKPRKTDKPWLWIEQLEVRCLLAATSPLGQAAASLPIVLLDPQGSSSPSGAGYSPAQIRQAYGFSQIVGLPGNNYNNAGLGQTIAIVDWNTDPTITNDLQQFDEYFNIGGAANNPKSLSFFQVVNQDGGTTLPVVDASASEAAEQALDVEWAHAIAPGANILLIEADSSNYPDLATAERYATTQPTVSVVSMSFGSPEGLGDLENDYTLTTPAGHQGIVFVAASGDTGSPPSYPATSPNVLAVGGTTLPQDSSGNPDLSLESGWSGSGGGLSQNEPEPSYQTGVVPDDLDPNAMRAVPDVAYDANPTTGFAVYNSFTSPTDQPWQVIGGTSAGAPQWAALIAIADQGRVAQGETTLDGPSQLLPALYQIANPASANYDGSAFNDITTGTSTGNPQYSAGDGYDLVTGLGTPNAGALVSDLVNFDSTPPLGTTFYWTGAAGTDALGNYDWDDPGNWSTSNPAEGDVLPSSVLPGPTDSVVIDIPNQDISHDETAYDTISSLNVTSTGVTLNLDAGTLDLSGSGAAGAFNVPGKDELGYGSVQLNGGTLANANVSKNTIITVYGATTFAEGLGTIVGGTLNGTVEMAGAAGTTAILDLAGKWVNNGTITNVPVISGISSQPFAGGGGFVLGDLWEASQADSSASGDAWVNNGTITIQNADVYLGGWMSLEPSANNLSTLDLSTDTVSLYGTLDNVPADNPTTQGTLTLTPGVTSSSGSWNLYEGRIDGGTLVTNGDAALTENNSTGTVSTGTLDGVTISATSSVQVSNGGELTIEGQGWSNLGTITVTGPTDDDPAALPSTLNLYGTWTNDGTISVDSSTVSLGSPVNISPTAAAAANYEWVNDGTFAFTGTGTVVNLGGVFTTATYDGIIDDLDNSNQDPTSVSFDLTGTLDNSKADNPVNQDVLALDDSTGSLSLNGGEIYEGEITTSGTNDLIATLQAGRLVGVALDGTLDMTQVGGTFSATQFSGATVLVSGGLTLDGTIELGGASGSSNTGDLIFGSPGDNVAQTISGSGTIQFGQDNTGNLLFNDSNEPLTFGPDLTVQVGLNSDIEAPVANIINQGTIANAGSGSLGMQANVTNSGTIDTGTGALSVTNYTQTSTGILDVEIGGTSQYGQLAVAGVATLGGTLNVAIVDGYFSNVGDAFRILAFGQLFDDFAAMNGLNAGSNNEFVPAYSSAALTLTVAGNTGSTSHPTLYWTGDARDGDWDDPGNWSYEDPLVSNVAGYVLPDAFDNVVVDLSNQTINLAAGNYDLISGLTVTGQNVTLSLSSDTLDLSGAGAALGVSSVVGGQGTFQVDQSGDVVDLQGTDLKSAVITSGTTLTVAGGALDNVQLDGTLDMTHQSGAALQVFDAVTINGTVELGGSSNSASLGFGYKNDASGMTVAGSGTIVFGQGGKDSLDNLSMGTLVLGSKLTIRGGHNSSILDLYPSSGPIDNKGTIEQSTDGGQLTINLPGWVNDGSIEVSNGATATLKGKGWTNSATGRITATDATLNLYGSWTNHGTIAIDPSTLGLGSPINVSPSDPSVPDYAWSNQGTLSIGAGSIVNLGSVLTTDDLNALIASGLIPPGSNLSLTGVLDNSPADNPVSGGILALGASTGSVFLDGGTIDGGTITTSGSDDLVATGQGGTLDGVTLDGTLDMTQSYGATVSVVDGLTLNGLIELGGAAYPAYLPFGGDNYDVPQTINGTGTIQFGQNYDNLIDLSDAPMIFGPGLTVLAGPDSYIDSYVSVDNQGTLEDNAGSGTLVIAAPNGFTNSGTVTIGTGATLQLAAGILDGLASGFAGDYTQSGGTTTVDGTISGENLNLNGGSLNGIGTITADLINAATVYPGDGADAPGALTVSYNYTQTATGILDINIAGTNQYSQLLGGEAGGTINVSLVNGFVPQAGDTFQILGDFGGGTFAAINGPPLGNGDSFTPFVNGNGGLCLLVTPPAPSLSPVYWTGDAADNDWENPGNWSSVDPAVNNVPEDVLPDAGDNVVVDLSGQTINQFGNDTIASLTVTGQNLTLDLDGTLDLSGSGSPGTFQVDQPGDSVVVSGVLQSAVITGGTTIIAQSQNYPGTLNDCVINGTVEVAAYGLLDLTGNWTNNGTIIAGEYSTLALGSQINIAPSDPSASDYDWSNKGTLSIDPTATVEVGGVITTDAFESLIPDLNGAFIVFIGTLDNSPADNPVSGGTFDLDTLPYGLTFSGGMVYQGTLTSADSTPIYGDYYTGGTPLPVDVTLDNVTLDGVPFYNASVAIQGGVTLDSDLYLDNASLIFDDSAPLTVSAGPLVPSATIYLSEGNLFNQSSQPVTLSSDITISGNYPNSIGGVDTDVYPQLSYYGPFINQGTIEQDGGELTIDAATWVNDGTIAATGATLNLYGNWTNNGTITADSDSTVSLGNAVAINPTSPAAAGYSWTNDGTITISAGATVYLGGVFTTDEYAGNFADRGVMVGLADDTVYLTGTMDNSAADNPITQGTLALSPSTGPLYLAGGEIYQGQVTTDGSDDLIATYSGGTLDGVTTDGTPEQLTLSVLHGTLTLGTTTNLTVTGNGTASLVVSGSLTSLNSDLPSLTYTPTPGYSGPDTLSLTDQDTADSLTGTASVSITVNPSQTPAITAPASIYENGTLTFTEDGTVVFTGGDAISVSDPSEAGPEQLTLSVLDGTLSLETTSGLTVTGNGSATLTLIGSVGALDFDLASLTYVPNYGYDGPDTLSLSDTDTGNSLTGTASVAMTVNSLVPTITGTTVSVAENGTLAFTGGTAIGVTDASATLNMSQGSANVTLVGGTLDSALDISGGGASATIIGGLTLNADVYLSGGSTFLDFNDPNPQAVSVGTLATSATIHLDGDGAGIDNESTQTLTFEPGITIAADSAQPTYADQDEWNTINGPIDNEGTIQEENLEDNLGYGNQSALMINLDQYDEYGLVRWTNGPTGTIQVASDGRLQLGGAWTNDGTITAADSVINSSTGTILGTELQLGDDLNSGPYDFHQSNSNTFVDNGTITSDAWQNFGTITTNDVNVYLGGWLSLDPSANNIATLDLSDNAVYLNGTLDNSPKDNPYTNGVLALTPGVTSSTGTWNLNGGRIYEGTVTTTDGAFLNAAGLSSPFNDEIYPVSGVLDAVTLDGTLNISVAGAMGNYSFSGLTIINNLVLNAVLDLNNGSTLYFVHAVNSGPFGQTLSGSGSIVFETGGAIDINNSADTSTYANGYNPASFPLTIGSGITIVGPGSGSTGTIDGPIDNQGTIEETAGGTLNFSFDQYNPLYQPTFSLVSWTNDTTGVIELTNGTLELGGAWTNYGAVTAANGTNIYLGDDWDFWDYDNNGGFYGYDYFGTNDVWVNNGTITTNSANVYLGGWLSYNPSADNLATLNLSENTVYLIGTLDNSPADNPASGGVLTLTPGVTSSTGAWYLAGGRIYEGTIDATAAALIATPYDDQYVNYNEGYVSVGGGTLYGVTLDGTLDMSAEIASVIIADGLTLDNDLNVSGLGAQLYVDGSLSQAVGVGPLVGGATIHLSGYGAQIATTYDISLPPSRSIATFDPTITISGEASVNYIGSGAIGTFNLDNQGTIEDNTTGSVLYVYYGSFVNWSGGNFGTLTGGTWKVSNGGILALEDENITTNAATISLSGANSHLESYHDFYYSDYTDALAGLMVNASNGNLDLSNGYVFSTPVFVENDGNIVVTSGASATLSGTAWDNSATGLISATDAILNLFGSWTNFGAVTADASTVSLGNPVDISPTDPSAPGYDWSSPGTIVFSGDCAVDLGGVFTADTFRGLVSDQLAAGQSLADDTLYLDGTLDGSVADNPVTAGVVDLDGSTGFLYLFGGRIYDADVTTAGSDDLVATTLGGTLDGMTLDGTLDMTQFPGATADVIDNLTLNGTIDLGGAAGTSNSATLAFGSGSTDTSPETMGGTGLLQFGQNDSGDTLDNRGSGTLTFGPNVTVSSAVLSYVESPNAAIDNQGTIEESTSSGALNVASPDGFSNAGSLIVGSGAIVSFGAANETQSAGTTTVDGTLIAANVYLDGGSLDGTGTVQANVTNAGAVAPGSSSGALTVQGNYVQNSDGALDVVLGALTEYSQLAISGSATLAGTLNVSLQNGFTPDPSNSFPILTYASESGGFTSEPSLNLGNGTSLTPVYSSGILTFTVGQESPSITVSTNTLALGTTSQGTAGSPQSFTVSGSDLTADILLTAPSGVQLSDNGGTSYSTTLDLAESGGTVGTTTVLATIAANASLGPISGTIAADSTGATEQDVTVSGTVEAPTQLTPTVLATDAGGTYNGNPFPASATASGAGGIAVNGSFAFTYYVGGTAGGQGSSTAPTTAGTYTVQAAFTSSNPNYDNADSAPVTFTIGQASPVVTLTDAGGVFDGNSYAATGTIAGVVAGVDNTPGGSLETVPLVLSYYVGTNTTGPSLSTAPSAAGSYTVVASFEGSQDYVSTSDQVTFAISPATPSVMASDAGGTYNGNPFPASASTTGVGGATVSGSFTFDYYVGSTASGAAAGTAPTNAGTYTVVAAFTSTNSNYATGPTDSAPVTFAISPAVPTVTATDVGGTYNGNSFPASGTETGVGGATIGGSFAFSYYVGSTAAGTPTSTAPSNAGTYTVVAAFTSNNSNYVTGPTDSASVTFTIGQATPTVVATDAGGTYDGDSFPANGTATGVGGAMVSGSFAFSYYVGSTASGTPTATAPTNAGIYTVVAAFTSTNSNYVTGPTDSAPVTLTIGQATPTVTATDAGGQYGGDSFPANGTATGVGGAMVSGSCAFPYYVGSTATGPPTSTAPTNAGTYTVLAAFTSSNANYVTGPTESAPVTFTIGQVTPKVVAADASGTYNGNPFSASATATGVGGATVSGSLTFAYYVGSTASGTASTTAPTNAGTYTVVAAFTSTNSNYVTGPTESAPVTFTIGQATPTVVATDAGGTYNGNPFPASATATGVGGAAVSGTFAFTYYVGTTASGTGTSTAPANVGTYTVVAAFTSTNSNYVTGSTDSAPITFMISSAAPSVHLGLLLLDPSGSGALDLTGSGAITVNDGGALFVDSNSSTAAVITGSGKVSASTIDVTGGTKVTGSGSFSSTVQHLAPLADPLSLSLPAAPSTTFAAVNDTGSARLTLSPGTYVGGIKIAGNGVVTLMPGVYYMEGGGFSITGSAMVTGAGILLINAPNKSTDTISLTGSGSLCLTPSNNLSGAYASYDGITILQNPASTNPINVTGSGVLNITGVLYAPKASVNIAGSGGLLVNPDATYGRVEVVVSDLNDAGCGFVTINVDAPAVTVGTPMPTSVPGESVPLVIKVCDPSSLAQGATFTFAISFGDGDIKTLTGPSSLIVNHVYTQTGTYLVTVTVTDEFGNTSAPVIQTIKVAPVAVETDPFNSCLTALFIGTSGNETVNLTASGSNRLSATPNGGSGIAVTLNGVSEGVYSTSGPVVVFEQGGSDTVRESGVTNSVDLIESLTTDNIEADLDNEAIQWAGLTAAVEILNA